MDIQTCIVCKKIFTKTRKTKTCSKNCLTIFRKENLVGARANRWGGGKIRKSCLLCKKDFYVFKYLAVKKKYCSRECYKQDFKRAFKYVIEKLKKVNIGRKQPEEERKRRSEIRKGFHPTEETRRKMRLSKKKFTRRNGYIAVFRPDHPLCSKNGYIFEHRIIMENFLGRFLVPGEVVHHINGCKHDNRIENLAYCQNESTHQKKFHYRIPPAAFKKGMIPWNKRRTT